MAEVKTRKTKASVKEFIDAIPDEQQRKDSKIVDKLMRELSGEKPAMWGPSIVGYGSCTYAYASGRTGDWPLIGFSPRKNALTLYVLGDYPRRDELLARLGKHTIGKSCLYLKKLSDVDPAVLRELIVAALEHARSGKLMGC